jgi:hypothetical protein
VSWRRIARPQALPHGTDAHRRDAAQRLIDFFTGGQDRGDLGARIDFLTGRADRSAQDLVRDIGDTRTVARLTGAAPRTVRDWRAGRHTPSGEHLQALEKEARRATVAALGGTNTVAAMTGRSAGTVRAWVRKPTAAKGDAVHQLNRHEVRDRHQRARRQAGQNPLSPLYLRVTGHTRVRPPGKPDYNYDVDRSVTHEITPQLQADLEDAIARGEFERVQQLIEDSLTSDYIQMGAGVYDGNNQGMFLDRIDDTAMLDAPTTPN